MQLAAEQQLDRYTVLDMLGQGGMAVVYRLRHNQLETEHALKVLTLTKKSVRQRLILEGKVQANLRHQNIVAVTDVLNLAGAPGLLMEYIAGPSLDDFLDRYRPSLDECEALFRGIVAGVAHAHSKDLVHRDLKPANVMLEIHDGSITPKVADFGLAKAFAEEEQEEEGKGRRRTRTGVAMGTPAYMAPEQIRSAKDVDIRADIFSLGCILYEMVTGELAFDGEDLPSVFNQIFSGAFESAASLNPELPARFLNVIQGCLLVDRRDRIPDCETLLAVLGGQAWESAAPVTQTWSGSAMDLGTIDNDDSMVDGQVSWPPPNFSFSDEALDAGYAPTPTALPSMEEVAAENMGASLISTSHLTAMADGTLPSMPQKTVIVHQGGGWLSQTVQVATLLVAVVILFAVARQNRTVQETVLAPIAAVTPDLFDPILLPAAAREELLAPADEDEDAVADAEEAFDPLEPVAADEAIVQVTGVTAGGDEADVTARLDLGSKYYDGDKEAAEAAEAEQEEEAVITAEVIVDDEDERADEVDITVGMTDEELAGMPAEKLESGKGAVIVRGDAVSVWLNSSLGRVRPGMVEAGQYDILADFGGGERGAGTVHVPAGKKIEIRCDAMFRKCVTNLLPDEGN